MRPLKILYAGNLSERDSALYRKWALDRAGHTVITLDALAYLPQSRLGAALVHRLIAGPHVARLNRDILALAERERPDIFWADKLLWLRPATLDRLRALGIRTVSYMIDNPFGTRNDPGWRVYMQAIRHWDLHIVQRDSNIEDYRRRGARDVLKIQTAYEPSIHFPPPPGWSDADRNRGVSFIGTPYDQRAEFLTSLWRDHGFPVVISGDRQWPQRLQPDALAALYTGGELYLDAYREAIWRSKINLSFLTHANKDEFAHKSFEIAACGGFLLAERSAGHLARFVEDEEAVFFTGLEECSAKIQRYLQDEPARTRIAAAGQHRALTSGYSNDAQITRILHRITTT